MKVKEVAEILSKVNPEAEFQVIVSGYPQEFTLTHGGSEGCTLANCDDFGPMVNAGETSEQEQPKGEGNKQEQPKGEGNKQEPPAEGEEECCLAGPGPEELNPEDLDPEELILSTLEEVQEVLEYYGIIGYDLDPEQCSLEYCYWTESGDKMVKHTVRIEKRD